MLINMSMTVFMSSTERSFSLIKSLVSGANKWPEISMASFYSSCLKLWLSVRS